mgnify:CR=1 FL=1
MKTLLLNLTIEELESLTCSYLKFHDCGANNHYEARISAIYKFVKALKKYGTTKKRG